MKRAFVSYAEKSASISDREYEFEDEADLLEQIEDDLENMMTFDYDYDDEEYDDEFEEVSE